MKLLFLDNYSQFIVATALKEYADKVEDSNTKAQDGRTGEWAPAKTVMQEEAIKLYRKLGGEG